MYLLDSKKIIQKKKNIYGLGPCLILLKFVSDKYFDNKKLVCVFAKWYLKKEKSYMVCVFDKYSENNKSVCVFAILGSNFICE